VNEGSNAGHFEPLEMWITVPGGTVWAAIHGADRSGTPLLVVHGGPGVPHDYLEPLAALADERPVVFYDQLGCGNSERPQDRSLWTTERAVEELAAVHSTFGCERMHLLGQSWGATLITIYTLDLPSGPRPREVSSLTLSAPFLSASCWMKDQRDRLSTMPPEVRDAVAEAERTGNYQAPAYRAATQLFYHRHVCRIEPWPECLDRTFRSTGPEVYLTMWGHSEFSVTGNLCGLDLVRRLREVAVPTLITCGRYDECSPRTAAWYRDQIPGAELIVFENASHLHHLEVTENYLATVRHFLARVDGKQGT
jgi:proline-specific peptidase